MIYTAVVEAGREVYKKFLKFLIVKQLFYPEIDDRDQRTREVQISRDQRTRALHQGLGPEAEACPKNRNPPKKIEKKGNQNLKNK